jgi:nitroreductase
MNEILETIFKRRSIRKFTEQPVEREKLELLLQAAMAAPTATNGQPWEYVVLTEQEVLEQLRKALPFAKMVAPAAICVLGSTRMQKSKAGLKFWVQDCAAATENILLAAVSLGLGAVWIGVHPVNMFIRSVEDILHLPEGVQPFNLIMIGYPAEEKEARTQYEDARVHWGPFPPLEKPRKSLTGVFRKDEIELRE